MLKKVRQQLEIYLAMLNLELNLPFLWRSITATSTRKLQMSRLRRLQRHHRSTLEQTYLDWTPSRLWVSQMLARRSELRPANSRPGSWWKPWPSSHPTPNYFRLVDYWETFSADMHARYGYAAIESGRKLSSDLKCSISFESPRKDCQLSTYRLPQRVSFVSICFGMQTMSVNGNRCIESIFRYYWCDRQWQDCATIIFLFRSGFRHRQPWRFAPMKRHRRCRSVIWSESPHLRRRQSNSFFMIHGWLFFLKHENHWLHRCCRQLDGIQSFCW